MDKVLYVDGGIAALVHRCAVQGAYLRGTDKGLKWSKGTKGVRLFLRAFGEQQLAVCAVTTYPRLVLRPPTR